MEQLDKSIFGVFLNQARLNAYITLCHISDKMGKGKVKEDSLAKMPVLELLGDSDNIIEAMRVLKFIEEHFPMLEIIYDKQNPPKDKAKNESEDELVIRSKSYKNILTLLLKTLNVKRNEYCHVNTNKKSITDRDLIRDLNDCFDAAVYRVKDRKKLDEKDVFHLRRKKFVGKNKPRVDNPEFVHYRFVDDNGKLNEKGLLFLISLFLQRGEAQLFLKQFHGFRKDDEPRYKATLEAFCVYRLTLPKSVISSDVDKNGLALDMLNNLGKCPHKLFELLSKEDKKKFLVTHKQDDAIDDKSNGNEGDNEDGDDEILMKRYSNRFSYFALRYCDENKLFENIRFHIDLGKYYFKIYDKQTIDGKMQLRALDKQLKTFGRIREVKEKVSAEWTDITKSPGQNTETPKDPYKADTTPHYHVVDNQIGIKLTEEITLPDIAPADGKITLKQPDAWLSIYTIPAMIFHGLTCGFNKTEALIRQYITNQQEAYNAAVKGDILKDKSYFPKALYKQEKVRKKPYALQKLEQMLKDTEDRARAITKTKERAVDKSNKPGKKNFFDIRAGKLADFLARDILKLQAFDPNRKGSDKLTSINFQVLQYSLAFYGAKKDMLGDMFKRIGLLDGKKAHPFLKEVRPKKYSSIVSFYEAYLSEKSSYLKKCKTEGKFDAQFLRPSRQCYAGDKRDLKAIAGELAKKPVNIPGNLFLKDIEESAREANIDLPAEYNTAYIIQRYFKDKYDGPPQKFYAYKRNHPAAAKAGEYAEKGKNSGIKNVLMEISRQSDARIIKKLIKDKDNILENGKFDPEHLKDNLLKASKDFEKDWRNIRRCQLEDMVTFMMVKATLQEQLAFETEDKGEGNPLRLENIIPPKKDEKTIFNQPILCTTEVTIPFGASETHHDKGYVDFIKNKYEGLYSFIQGNKKIELKYKITSENTKLKDLGKYRRYFYDRRSPGLLIWKYPPNAKGGPEIKYSDIEDQIKAYQQHRLKIAGLLYVLEKKVIERWVSPEELSGEGYISFNQVIEKVKERLPDSNDKCDTLLNIRNAVYHNQFPAFEDAIDNANGENIADKMLSVTKNYVNDITEQITQNDKELENV